jgi:hypothetical protein
MANSESNPFRILSLDGGGIKGVFTAAFLAEIERMTGKRLADYFDLIAGTSTGGIIAIGLGVGLSGSDLLNFYLSNGPTIFPSMRLGDRFSRGFRWLVRGKHDPAPLKKALQSAFGDKKLSDSHSRLVVPAFDAVSGSITVFKTAHCEHFKQDYLRTCVDVALASSAAPTFLPGHYVGGECVYLDGGVWANNPTLVGVLEAVRNLGCQSRDIDVLNVGTTDETFHIGYPLRKRAGVLRWGSKLVPLLMHAQGEGAIKQATLLLDTPPYRVSPIVAPSRFKLDDARDIADLTALGIKCARNEESTLNRRFLEAPVAPFVSAAA